MTFGLTYCCVDLQLKWRDNLLTLFFRLSNQSHPSRYLLKGATVHYLMCTGVHSFGWRIFWECVVKCSIINCNNSTVIKLEMITVIVLRQLQVKYCVVKVFIVQCNLSMKPKISPFSTYFYINFFYLFWCEITLEVCPSLLDTTAIFERPWRILLILKPVRHNYISLFEILARCYKKKKKAVDRHVFCLWNI
jgi:hypothetical protein